MRDELTVSLSSGNDVSGRLTHHVDDVQWTVRLTSDHDRSMSRFGFYLVTMTTTTTPVFPTKAGSLCSAGICTSSHVHSTDSQHPSPHHTASQTPGTEFM